MHGPTKVKCRNMYVQFHWILLEYVALRRVSSFHPILHPFVIVAEVCYKATQPYINDKLSFSWHFETFFSEFFLNIIFLSREFTNADTRNTHTWVQTGCVCSCCILRKREISDWMCMFWWTVKTKGNLDWLCVFVLLEYEKKGTLDLLCVFLLDRKEERKY
jgi:hypothetical protein